MKESDRLQQWLAQGASKNPLDEVVERFEEIEGLEALLRQCENYRKAVAVVKALPCICGKVYASGAVVTKCERH